jgi:hypothetical protein
MNYYTIYIIFQREPRNPQEWVSLIRSAVATWGLQKPLFSDFSRAKWHADLDVSFVDDVFRRVNRQQHASNAIVIKDRSSEWRFAWQNTDTYNHHILASFSSRDQLKKVADHFCRLCKEVDAQFGIVSVSAGRHEKLQLTFGWKTFLSKAYLRVLELEGMDFNGSGIFSSCEVTEEGVCLTTTGEPEKHRQNQERIQAKLRAKWPKVFRSPECSLPAVTVPRVVSGTAPRTFDSRDVCGKPAEFLGNISRFGEQYGFKPAGELSRADLKQLEDFCGQFDPVGPDYFERYRAAVAVFGSIFKNETKGEWIVKGIFRKTLKLRIKGENGISDKDPVLLLEHFLVKSESPFDRIFDVRYNGDREN